METQHTPGPWEIRYDILLAEIPGDNQLARIRWFRHHIHRAEANARLIAAAPDLLDACKMARTLGTLAQTSTVANIKAMLDTAIAKAEGRI